MDQEGTRELDYCDLDPGKICDNCCKCLDIDKPYNEIEAELLRTDRIDEGNDRELVYDDFEDGADDLSGGSFDFYEGGEGEDCDSSRVPPIDIDPALKAEWERRLKDYEARQKAAYMHTLRGARKDKQ